jgi:hypothetical protein
MSSEADEAGPMPRPIACVLDALTAEQKLRQRDLVSRLRSALTEVEETADGFRARPGDVSLVEIAEWIALERRCCPFVRFTLEVEGEDTIVAVSGPEGTKAIFAAELDRRQP